MKLNKKGFSLLEFLTAVGLLALLSLGLATVLKMMKDSSVVVGGKLSEADLMNGTIMSAYARQSCDVSFKGKTLNDNGILVINQMSDRNGVEVVKSGMVLEQANHKVKSIRLYVPSAIWTKFKGRVFTIPNETVLLPANLEIAFSRPGKGLGEEISNQIISFPVSVNQTGTISKCAGGSVSNIDPDAIKNACLEFGGVFDATSGQCKLTEDCSKLASGIPVSQKCAPAVNTPAGPSPAPKVYKIGKAINDVQIVQDCFVYPGADLTRTKSAFNCSQGSFSAKAENGVFSFGFGSNNFTVTDPEIYKLIMDTLAQIPIK